MQPGRQAVDREAANRIAFEKIISAEPALTAVEPARSVVPGMTENMVLTSGAPLPWGDYVGPQRQAIIGGALFEGLASDENDASRKIEAGEIVLSTCHEHDCVGSVAGIFTASMPVFVVENTTDGNRAFCNLFEGPSRKRLNYGSYDEDVRNGLLFLQDVIGPTLAELINLGGPIPLTPIMSRALHMGDELHSRNTAASLMFSRELLPRFLQLAEREGTARSIETLEFLTISDYFFLRLTMAAAKATINAAHGVVGSTVVTAMLLSCRDFAVRLSGLGEEWFRGPLPDVEAVFFDGYSKKDNVWSGGESHHAELIGLGGFAQAAAFGLQKYSGGTASRMADLNESMYSIVAGENPRFQIPYFNFRGTPTGIDAWRVVESGVCPVIDGGLVGTDGTQIGAGTITVPMACFEQAIVRYREQYP